MSIRNYIKKNRRQSSIAYSTICSGATSLNTPQLAAGSFISAEKIDSSNEPVIMSTDVMTGDRDRSRFLYYQLKMSMSKAKGIDIIVSQKQCR